MEDHFILNKQIFATPIFVAFPATKLKTAVCLASSTQLFDAKKVCKNPRPAGQRLFSPKHPDILTPPGWPCPNDPPPRKGPLKRHPQNPHRQQAAKRRARAINIRTEQRRKDDPQTRKIFENKESRTHDKAPHKQKHKKWEEHEQNDNESNECKHKRQVGPKESSVPNTKPKRKQQKINNKESFVPSKRIRATSNKNMFCGWKKSTKEKRNNDSVKGHLCKVPQRQTKWNTCCLHCFPIVLSFSSARGAWEKKKHMMRKRRKKDKNHNSKNNQTRYTQRSRKKK